MEKVEPSSMCHKAKFEHKRWNAVIHVVCVCGHSCIRLNNGVDSEAGGVLLPMETISWQDYCDTGIAIMTSPSAIKRECNYMQEEAEGGYPYFPNRSCARGSGFRPWSRYGNQKTSTGNTQI